MKKLFLLFTVLFTVGALHAQRITDISVNMFTPSTGDTLHEGVQFQVSYEFTNNGPDTIKANTDTLVRAFVFNNNIIGSPTPFYVTNDLLPDSTITRTINFTFTSVPQPMQGNFCVYIGIQNKGQDSARDNNQQNNYGCAQVFLTGNPASVKGIYNVVSKIKTYPNPAIDQLNVALILEKPAPVAITLLDLQGKVISQVVNQNNSLGEYNALFDASGLQSGMYLLEIKAGEYTRVEKVIVR